VKIPGKWYYLYRGVDLDGQVLDCWLAATRDLPAAEAFFRRTIGSTKCTPVHVVTDKATFYPSAIRAWAPDAKHTATGFYNRVISTNRCERSHGYVKSRLRPMRGLKSLDCAKRLLPTLDAMQLIERGFRRCVMYRAATRWRTELCARPPRCRHRQPARPGRVEPATKGRKDTGPPLLARPTPR